MDNSDNWPDLENRLQELGLAYPDFIDLIKGLNGTAEPPVRNPIEMPPTRFDQFLNKTSSHLKRVRRQRNGALRIIK